MSEANLQSEWAGLLFASFADAGVRDVIISPGSRSTPLVIAAVREPRLARHTIIDERAAGFFALGQARVTRRPSVVVCTSGTAPAHYLPSMIEANLTGTPMIVLSADRPHELYDCRAPQTIDQVKLFGEHALRFFELVPEASEPSLRALRRVAAQAVTATAWPRAGAVHINARWRKPLEPVSATTDDERRLKARVASLRAERIVVAPPPRSAPSSVAIDAAVKVLAGRQRGLIIAGPASLAQSGSREGVWALARATGFVVAAEATSQLRFVERPAHVCFLDAFELLLRQRTFRASNPFDVVIQIGAPPTSGPWEELAATKPYIVLAEDGWPDPHSRASVMVFGEVGASVAALAAAREASAEPIDPTFASGLGAANRAAWECTERVLAESELAEAMVARALVERAPASSLLVVGNSLAVRLVDTFARAVPRDLGVLSQRGASGIDGLVAGAAGAATVAARPVALLIGDVSLLHDLTSLALLTNMRTPFVVVVLHNGGGRIFDQLPISSTQGIEPSIVEHATTPHDLEFGHAAAMFGLRHARVSTLPEVESAIDAAYGHDGCTLLEVRVAANGAIALSRRVSAALDAEATTSGDRKTTP